MARTADDQAACDSADRTGEHHRADDYFFYIDTGIARSILALADNCDLISLFAVFHVYIHAECNDQNNDHVQSIHISKNGWEPSFLSSCIDDADRVRTGRILPEYDGKCDKLHCHIIEHQCKQCLICIEICFKHCRDQSPDQSCRYRTGSLHGPCFVDL